MRQIMAARHFSDESVEVLHLDCSCQNFIHSIRFYYDTEWRELQVETHLGNWLPWYKRIWLALKYVFKVTHPKHLQYDCALIHPKDYGKLKALIERAQKADYEAMKSEVLNTDFESNGG